MSWFLLCLLVSAPSAPDLRARIQKLIDTSGAEVAVVFETLDARQTLTIDQIGRAHV